MKLRRYWRARPVVCIGVETVDLSLVAMRMTASIIEQDEGGSVFGESGQGGPKLRRDWLPPVHPQRVLCSVLRPDSLVKDFDLTQQECQYIFYTQRLLVHTLHCSARLAATLAAQLQGASQHDNRRFANKLRGLSWCPNRHDISQILQKSSAYHNNACLLQLLLHRPRALGQCCWSPAPDSLAMGSF